MSVRRRQWTYNGQPREGWYVDIQFRHSDGRVTRVREASPVDTRRGAEEYERQIRAALLAGTWGQETKQSPTVARFAEQFLTHAKANNKHSSQVTKQSVLRNHLLPAFGELRLDEVSAGRIDAYAAKKLAEGQSKKSVNNHLTMIRKMLSLAVKWGELQAAPEITWLKAPDPEFDSFAFDEAERLVAAAEAKWRPMIVVALNTGLRVGELLALRWDDVDLVSGRLMVRRTVWRGHVDVPKGGRSREVPLNGTATATLKAHRHLRGELVFCGEAGAMLTEGEVKWPLWRQCKLAGLRRAGWHVLRHTFASHLVMRGVPIKAVQELLGHVSIEMTMRYAHLSPDVRREAVSALDAPPRGTSAAQAAGKSSNPA